MGENMKLTELASFSENLNTLLLENESLKHEKQTMNQQIDLLTKIIWI